MRAFIILLVGMILLSSCGDSPASSNKSNNLTLSDFIFKDQDLPRNCRIAPVETTEELPYGAKSNPFLSSERRFLDCFAGELLHDKAVVATTRSALFSVYLGRNEVGVFGLEFDSETSARKAVILLQQEQENTDNQYFATFQRMRIVVFLWRDDKTDACFDSLRELVIARLK